MHYSLPVAKRRLWRMVKKHYNIDVVCCSANTHTHTHTHTHTQTHTCIYKTLSNPTHTKMKVPYGTENGSSE